MQVDIFLTRRLSKSLAFCEFASINFKTCNSSRLEMLANFRQIIGCKTGTFKQCRKQNKLTLNSVTLMRILKLLWCQEFYIWNYSSLWTTQNGWEPFRFWALYPEIHILGASWCCRTYYFLSFCLWWQYYSASFQSSVLCHYLHFRVI